MPFPWFPVRLISFPFPSSRFVSLQALSFPSFPLFYFPSRPFISLSCPFISLHFPSVLHFNASGSSRNRRQNQEKHQQQEVDCTSPHLGASFRFLSFPVLLDFLSLPCSSFPSVPFNSLHLNSSHVIFLQFLSVPFNSRDSLHFLSLPFSSVPFNSRYFS